MSRRRFVQAGAIASASALSGCSVLINDSEATPTTRNSPTDTPESSPGTPVSIDDLLSKMTLEEKVGQMTQIDVRRVMGSSTWARSSVEDLSETWLERILTDRHVGSILSGGGAAPVPNTPTEWAKLTNRVQRYAIEETRLGIPIVYGVDAVHGHNNVEGATIFPHNLGLGAAGNPRLAMGIGEATGEAMAATGTHWNFDPVADLQRDPRWGRYYEGFSESPRIAEELAADKVVGQQGTGDGLRVSATTKHFAGYSQPANGNDRAPAHVSTRNLRGKFFRPYRGGIDAGSGAVMVNSGSVNGVPSHASSYLLTDVLRDRWGFEGVVISDWHDFHNLVEQHDYAQDLTDAIAVAVNAGVDVYMVPMDAAGYTDRLVGLVEDGRVPESRIDEAARRVLEFKRDLGLFDDPYVDPGAVGETVGANRDLAREAAGQSMTLLKNDGALPLSGDESVLLTGPGADDVAMQMGGWTIGWQGVPDDANPPATTVADAFGERVDTTHVPTGRTEFGAAEEVRNAAGEADVVVAVLGEGPYAEGQGDTDTLALPTGQRRLLETLDAAGTPTVGVFFAGRPRGTASAFDRLNAALMGYLPGSGGGAAVADVVFGDRDPAGRLPFTWPRSVGQIRNLHNELPATHGNEPLFAFGHGLSYADLVTRSISATVDGDALEFEVELANRSDRASEAVVHVTASRSGGPVIFPRRRVVAFDRLAVSAGGSTTKTITAPLPALAIVPGDERGTADRVVAPGEYEVSAGQASTTLRIESERTV